MSLSNFDNQGRFGNYDGNYSYRSALSRKKKSGNAAVKIILVVAGILLLSSFAVFGIFRYLKARADKIEMEGFSTAEMKQDIYIDYSVIGMKTPLAIKGMTKQEVYDKVLSSYTFNIKIKNSNPELDIFEMPNYGAPEEDTDLTKYMASKTDDILGSGQEVKYVSPLSDITIKASKDVFVLPDFLEGQLKKQIDDIYDKYLYISTNEFNKKGVDINSKDFVADFKFEAVTVDENLDDSLMQLARLWDTKAVRGQIEGFNRESNEFTFGEDHKGFIIDQDELRNRIVETVNNGKLVSDIWTILKTVDPEGSSVKSRYRYASVYETWTTDNDDRNKNIKLACEKINGTIVKPGQEFSFNKTVGERTEEKGYLYAPAYLEGQVVEELGGGVCQVSTTLYNAVFGAGLTTTYRKSHTFEPAYITPGLDATVSFNGPDYKFINNSDYSVGIRATYAKRKVKVEIFAVPLLKAGTTQNLISNKLQDLDYPTISIITEGKATRGTQGSEWQVFKVTMEDDKEIGRIFDHSAVYQGHTPTAFEEFTYIDEDGLLATSKFVETTKKSETKKRQTVITTAKRENTIQSIAPREQGNVVQVDPNGNTNVAQPQ